MAELVDHINEESDLTMKTRSFACFIALGLSWVPAALAEESYKLSIDGLACPFCTYGIEKQLTALDVVETIETSIKDGTVIVTTRDGTTLDEATARQAVSDAGFTLNGFEQIDGR